MHLHSFISELQPHWSSLRRSSCMFSRASIGGAISNGIPHVDVINGISERQLSDVPPFGLFYLIFPSLQTWWRRRRGGGCEGGERAQRPIAINWGQSRYEKSIIWKFVCQQIVLRHFMVWRVTEPLSSAFTAKWRNQEISTESDPLLSIPWGNMNLRVNEFTPFTRRLCPDVFMAPGCPRLRWAQEAQADPLDNNTKKKKKNMNTNVQRFELPF